MSFATQRHLSDVKARMARYAEEQDHIEFDQNRHHDFDDLRDGAHKGLHNSSKPHHKSASDPKKHEHTHVKCIGSPALHRRHGSSSSSSTSHHSSKKGLEHPPRDGLTGMGPSTQRHFAKVKMQMEHYCDDQNVEHDRERAHRTSSPGIITVIGRFFGAEKGLQVPGHSHGTHTPTTARKRSEHLNLASPRTHPRERHTKSVSDLH